MAVGLGISAEGARMLAIVAVRANLKDEVAAAGFPDQSYFSRVFPKLLGMTPKEFRTRGTAELSES